MATSNPFRKSILLADTQALAPDKLDFSPSRVPRSWIPSGDDAYDGSMQAAGDGDGDGDAIPPSECELLSTTQPSPPAERLSSRPPPPVVHPRKRGTRAPVPSSSPGSSRLHSPVAISATSDRTLNHPDPSFAITPASPAALPSNPFSHHIQSTDDVPRSTDIPASTSFRQSSESIDAARGSLDVDAFKQIMLTGQAAAESRPPASSTQDSTSTDNSSASRQSIFESILEGPRKDMETEPGSYGIDGAGEAPNIPSSSFEGRQRSSSASSRQKPLPPKPRSRSGGKSSPQASQSTLTILPAGKRPLSLQLDKPLPQLSVNNSPEPAPSSKKTPPAPPLSRRLSTQSRNLTPNLERPGSSKGMRPPPPPPPPLRRKSTTSRQPSANGTPESAPLSSGMLPPPPPPPRKGRDPVLDVINAEENSGQDKPVENDGSNDILTDLEKLQREVDELRDKYEGTMNTQKRASQT